jgi:hypothetical protein
MKMGQCPINIFQLFEWVYGEMRFNTREAILPSVKRSGSEYLDILMSRIFLFPAL